MRVFLSHRRGNLMVYLAARSPHRREAATRFWLLAHQLSQRSEAERLASIQAGFGPCWIDAMRHAFHLGPQQLEALFNASVSTLERRQRQQRSLDPVASERLDRVAMLASHALHIFKTPERAGRWMITPGKAHGDRTPLQLCETGIGAAQAHRALAELDVKTLEQRPAIFLDAFQRPVSTTTRPRT
ncbi:putative toxin-antitoxin system antitoxin component [Pseudomonas coronafaciens pv. striafaciens]|nr:putative toxin-antitoxin system antitoxin component [Pseudomonas coronafaciens pv. striafaciens]RMP22268.1 putative toxin-antitoxin system antitoxin component [Pseudomonas coronafaciens pv. atropurpurea]